MILRKPYAILIKFFKLIHIIMFILFIFIAYKLSVIYHFFREFVVNSTFVKIENIIVDSISNAELDYDTLGVLCQLGSDDDSLKEGKSFKHSNGLVYFKTDTWGKISKEGDLTIIEYDESDNLVIKKENNKGRSRTLKK